MVKPLTEWKTISPNPNDVLLFANYQQNHFTNTIPNKIIKNCSIVFEVNELSIYLLLIIDFSIEESVYGPFHWISVVTGLIRKM